MYTIGFANKFHTLWNVSEPFQVRTSEFNFHYEQTFTYIKNLSFDLNEAKSKLGDTPFVIDLSLKGQKSFTSKYEVLNDAPENVFAFGKYVGNELSLDDPNYLKWYHNATQNKIACDLLVKAGFILYEDMIYSSDEYEQIKINIFINSLVDGHHYDAGSKQAMSLMEIDRFWFQGRFGSCAVVKYATDDGKMVKYIGGSPSDYISEVEYTTVTANIAHNSYNEENFTKISRIKKI